MCVRVVDGFSRGVDSSTRRTHAHSLPPLPPHSPPFSCFSLTALCASLMCAFDTVVDGGRARETPATRKRRSRKCRITAERKKKGAHEEPKRKKPRHLRLPSFSVPASLRPVGPHSPARGLLRRRRSSEACTRFGSSLSTAGEEATEGRRGRKKKKKRETRRELSADTCSSARRAVSPSRAGVIVKTGEREVWLLARAHGARGCLQAC